MIQPGRRMRRGAAVLIAAALTVPGCSGGEGGSPVAAAPSAPTVARDLASYEAFVLASAENNPLFADVYGIRFDPLVVDRITTDKRISSLGADQESVIVAAADRDVDRLAVVNGDGTLSRVPGLGRPFAYSPTVVDGTMYYEDFTETPTGDVNRYFAWDLSIRKRTKLFRYVEDLGGITPTSKQRFVFGLPGEADDADDMIVIRDRVGQLTRFPVGENGTGLEVGRTWIATNSTAADDEFGNKPEDLLLLNPDTGKRKKIPGLQAICWSPDGTKLLARRTASPTDSQLVLLDPAQPKDLVELDTVPNLFIYSGVWVRGTVPT